MSKVSFKIGDKVILVRGFTNPSGKTFTAEMLLDSYPLFKDPQEISEIDYSASLLTFYKPNDMPCLYFMIDNKKLGSASTCFDLYDSISTPQTHKCCCSIRDLMIRGCNCGGV